MLLVVEEVPLSISMQQIHIRLWLQVVAVGVQEEVQPVTRRVEMPLPIKMEPMEIMQQVVLELQGGGGVVPSHTNYALGGAGWLSNGNISNFTCTNRGVASLAPRNGATGGNSNQAGTFGGFGGGGAPAMMCGAIAGGGGGGYSGGGPGAENPGNFYNGGGGGGSYNGGSSPITNGATNTGAGSVTITFNPVAAAIITSFNLTGNATTATYRNSVNIIVGVDTSSRVSFRAGGVRIPGCTNIATTGSSPNFTATCSWKPSRRGNINLSAVATPTSGGDSGTNQTQLIVAVRNRTGNR